MKWLWIRHGETDMNRQKRYVGHSDVPLNERGQFAAKELAKRWASAKDGAVRIYSSDLCRCVQTAQPLAQAWGVQIATVSALRELSFGDWELFTYEQLMAHDAKRAARWYDDPLDCAPPNGESLRQLGERVGSWLRGVLAELTALRNRHGAARLGCGAVDEAFPELIAVVTHGGVIRWFQAAWLAQDPERYWQTAGLLPGEALLVEWDGQRWTVPSAEVKTMMEEHDDRGNDTDGSLPD
ncbi:histidine phosphatase family protein [Brevibacillus sp. GCM10020057]|uniref:histidine phosphatase family protein n=1 Tax=Brevibacillus sp. GCM10020057 TaxID=3317327 RepID=UPI0036402C45